MGSIDLNCLSEAAFEDEYGLSKNKFNIPYKDIKAIRKKLLETIKTDADQIDFFAMTLPQIKEKIFKLLKTTLALSYIYHINLNDFINVSLHEDNT